ncbi:hypothetical protein Csa_003633 [Cucumis sativus]|nr:hypothetical protein Csa_003633 [Cucumis sativus]
MQNVFIFYQRKPERKIKNVEAICFLYVISDDVHSLSGVRGQNQTPHTNQCLKLEKAKNPPIVVGNGLSHLFDDLFVKKFEGL